MTTPMDPFERKLPDALADLASPRTPDYMFDILGQTAARRQSRPWVTRARRQSTSRTGRLLLLGVAALLATAIGGATLIASRPEPAFTQRPPIVTGELVPKSLIGSWTGVPRPLPSGTGDSIRLLMFTASALFGMDPAGASFISRAVLGDDGRLVLQSTAEDAWCTDGSEGRYDWAVSADGHGLILSGSDDPCAIRHAALVGEWTFRPDADGPCFHCRGELGAGTYRSVAFDPVARPGGPASDFGHLTYTVPTGWMNTVDSPVAFGLAPTPTSLGSPSLPDGSGRMTDGILLLAHPTAIEAAACAGVEPAAADDTAASLMASVVASPFLQASPPEPVDVAGVRGIWADLQTGPSVSRQCDGGFRVPVIGATDGPMSTAIRLGSDDRTRLYLLDRPDGTVVAIAITATDPDRFDALVAAATPIVSEMVFD